MSIVLVMGLMPLPAFADSSLRAGGFAEPQEEAAEPESTPLQDAADAAGSALSALGANVMGAISTLGNVQNDPVVLDSGTCGENLTWEYWDDARLVISGTGDMDDYASEAEQPWNAYITVIERLVVEDGVTSIGDYAFSKGKLMQSVEFPESLLRIDESAFRESGLSGEVDLPGSLVYIGDYAFYSTSLESVVVPPSVSELGVHVFEGNGKLQRCSFQASLALIPESSFENCTKLSDITMSDDIATIGPYAFKKCSALSSIELSRGLEIIEEEAFKWSGLQELTLPDGTRRIGVSAFYECPFTSVCMPDTVTEIEYRAFWRCESLSSIRFSQQLVNIGGQAFDGCQALESLLLPDSLLTIGRAAFCQCVVSGNVRIPALAKGDGGIEFAYAKIGGGIILCEGLIGDEFDFSASAGWVSMPSSMLKRPNITAGRYYVSDENPVFSSIDGDLYSSDSSINHYENKTDVLLRCGTDNSGDYSICEGTKEVDGNAFTSVNTLSIPASVEVVGQDAIEVVFDGFEVAEDNSVFASSESVLYSKDQTQLIKCPRNIDGDFTLPNTVEVLGERAFGYCTGLKFVHTPERLKSIGDWCFAWCWSLKGVYLPAGIETVGHNVFESGASKQGSSLDGITIFYGGSEDEWNQIEIDRGADGSGNKHLYDSNRYYDVVSCGMSGNLMYCLDTFGEMTLLRNKGDSYNRYMDSYLTDLAPWAEQKSSITSVMILDGILSVGANAFSECPNLETVSLPSGLKSVGEKSFSNCPSLASVMILDGLLSIGASAFSECSSLETVSLPYGLTNVGENSFSGCLSLRRVYCKGEAFTVSPASSDRPSFDAETVTLYYPSDLTSWVTGSNYDSETSAWNGYRVSGVDLDLPALSSVLFESDTVRVSGGFHKPDSTVSNEVRILAEDGTDLSDKVSVSLETSVARERPLATWADYYYEVERLELDVSYDAANGCVSVGKCALAGEYTLVVSPITGRATGDTIRASFYVERDAEVCAGAKYFTRDKINDSNKDLIASGCNRDGSVSWTEKSMHVRNQYFEEVTDDCVFSWVDELGSVDVTDCELDSGYSFAGNTISFSSVAVPRSFTATAVGVQNGLQGERTVSLSVSRLKNLLNVPALIDLTGGDEDIVVCESDQWASTPYRVRVTDAYLDPCWPELTWSVINSFGMNVSQYFDVDEQGYLFVDAGVRDILADGDNEFTVKCTAGEASDTAPLVIRKAAEEAAPATHTATFKAGGEVVGEVVFAEGDSSLEEPDVPQRENYIGAWEEYDLASATGDIEVNAVYAPIGPDAVSEVEGEATADYDKSVVTINLAAAAATRQVKVESESTKPVDVVMVLDQSGSMADALGAGQTKRDALVECANSFAQQLYDNAAKTGADHRVALVGFAYSAYNNGRYKNTGLLAGAGGAKNYAQLSRSDYAGALLPVRGDGGVNPAVTAGIDSIVADGATAADVGLKVAKNVFSENPVAAADDGTPERERIVVFITDGVPTSWGQTSSLVRETAAEAILMARDIKQGQGARVYSVGVDAAADPAAAFNDAADGVVAGARDTFKSYDFNRFLHAVSSDYPEASGMADLGDGAKDAGYYMAVNDTSSLGKIFRSILYSAVYSIETFDRAALSYTLPDGFVLTMRQEEEMRAALAGRGMADDDIVVATDCDGKTTIAFKNVRVVPETVDGVVKYVARVSFQVTADAGVSGSVSAGSAVVEQNGEAAAVEVPAVEVPDDRCLVVFKVNDAVYEVREATIGDEIELPDTNLARWLDLEKMQEQGTAQVSGAYAVFETSTLTRTYNVNWTVGENSVTTSFAPGAAVAVPDEVLAWVPGGFELAGWSPALPATMPARNISATAVLTPEHVHDYSFSSYRTGSCDEGIVTHHVCACGEETTEQAEPKAHAYDAVLSSSGRYATTVEKLVCRDCGHSVDKSVTYQVSQSSFWNATVLDLSKLSGEVVQDGASDDAISMRFYVGGPSAQPYTVVRIDEDGTRTTYSTRLADGYLVFDPDHFSVYAIERGGDGLSYDEAQQVLGNPELPEVEGDPEGESEFVEAADLSGAAVSAAPQTYTGAALEPDVTVTLGGEAVPAAAYSVEYSDNTNAGTATVTVTGTGDDYRGVATGTFEIAPAPSAISLAAQSKTYAGKALAYSGKVTRSGSGGKVTYAYYSDSACKKAVRAADVKAAGTYYVKAALAADANHEAATSAAARFTIGKASLKSATVSNVTYTGKAVAPAVKAGTATFKAGTDYTITYKDAKGRAVAAKNLKAAGTYKATVTGKGSCTGSVTRTFQVVKAANPMSVSAKSPSVAYSKAKAQVVKAAGAYKFAKKAVGAVTYSRVAKGSASCLSVNAKTGDIAVKKGAKKGTYAVVVKVAAKGNANYKSASKTVTVKVKVK